MKSALLTSVIVVLLGLAASAPLPGPQSNIIQQLQDTFDRDNPDGTRTNPGNPDDLNGDGVINAFEAGAQAGKRGNKNVEKRGNRSVEKRGNRNVVTRGNRNVETRGNRSVETRGNKNVETRGNKNVETRGNRNVETRGNRNVETSGNRNVEKRQV